MNQTRVTLYYLVLSIVAAALILGMVFMNTTKNTNTFNDRLLLTGVFIVCCIFGISLAIHPGWFRRFKINEDHKVYTQTGKIKQTYKGHHPICGMFQSHTLVIKNKIRCAGCLGLILGSIASIIIIILYMGSIYQWKIAIFNFFLVSGLFVLALAYVGFVVPLRYPIMHVISNSILVVSFLFITLGVFEITGNILYGLLVILLSFLWLSTKVQLSHWQHMRICRNCRKICKTY